MCRFADLPHLASLLALLAAAPACGFHPLSGARSESARWIGEPAPSFTATTLDGQPLALDGLRGEVVLLDFWATWCPPCRAEIPNLRGAWERYRGQGFRLVSIALEEPANRRSLEGMIAAKRMSWTHVQDDGDRGFPISRLYGVETIPATFLIDREGVIRAVDLRGAEVERAIGRLLGSP